MYVVIMNSRNGVNFFMNVYQYTFVFIIIIIIDNCHNSHMFVYCRFGGSLDIYPQPDVDERRFLNFIETAQDGLLQVRNIIRFHSFTLHGNI